MKLSICTEWLLFHLWKNNPETGKSCPGIIIPETIIYRWAQPYFWYFTSREGTLIRKTKDRISVDHLYNIFTQSPEQSQENEKKLKNNDIIATYMKSQQVKNYNEDIERIDMEYLQYSDFQQFLYQRDKMLSAILQKFVQPQKEKNQMIKVTWTPQFCLFFRKINIHDINNQKVSMNDRLATFDGKEHLSYQDSICSPTLQKDIEHLCVNIIKHIQEVSGGNIQISRMVLYMKVDIYNKLQLLYCTDIKIREKYTLQVSKMKNKITKRQGSPIMRIVEQHQTNDIDLIQMNVQNTKEPLKQYQGKHCLYCKKIGDLYDVSFQHVIMSYEQQLMKNEDFLLMNPVNEDDWANRPNYATTLEKQGLDFKVPFLNEDQQTNHHDKQVPLFLEYVWGKMSQAQYDVLKQNVTWTQLSTKVCDVCYMNFTVVSAVPQTEIKHQQKNGDQFKDVKAKLSIQPQNITQSNPLSIEDLISQRYKSKINLQIPLKENQTSSNFNSSQRQKITYKSEHRYQDDNMNENQRKYITFKQASQATQKDFFTEKQDKKQDFLYHLRQLENYQLLAKNNEQNQIEHEKFQKYQDQKKKIQENLKSDKTKIYQKRQRNVKLPKVFVSQRDKDDSFNTASTQDNGSNKRDHNVMIKTLREIKQHLQQI